MTENKNIADMTELYKKKPIPLPDRIILDDDDDPAGGHYIGENDGRPRTTIRKRIIRLTVISAAVTAVVLGVLTSFFTYSGITGSADMDISNLAKAYASAVENADIAANRDFINNLFKGYNSEYSESGSIGFVINGNNAIFSETGDSRFEKGTSLSEKADDPDYSELAALAEKMQDEKTDGSDIIKIFGKSHSVAYSKVGGYDGIFTVIIVPRISIVRPVVNSVIAAAVSAVVLFVICCIVSSNAAAKITQPIVDVTERLKMLAHGDVKSSTPVTDRDDETKTLVNALGMTVSNLNSYIGDIRNVLSNVASGNLLVRSETEYAGDFTSIKESLEMIIESLNRTFGEVNHAAARVRDYSSQVSGGAVTLSDSASNEAATIEQLTASINDISAKVSHNAEKASQASTLTKDADEEVEKGNVSMENMLDAINELERLSSQIAEIIKVIDDIAFQTNILALNAAIEAARAGAAGKGFAVVADEVRNLATKSAEAASQTGKLINSSIEAIEKSTGLAENTSKALASIVEKVRSVDTIVDSIAVSAKEEAAAVAQLSSGMELISQTIQTTSTTAGESASASSELTGQSDELNRMLSRFNFRR